MADRAPDEIISEILSPLLKHSDEVFSDTSEKSLVIPGFSSSAYLLVCKAWLRVSTPLLYNVVILRTTGQAEALEKVLKENRVFGSFIKKLRIEGGFGPATHTILKCAPNITDIFMTLSIWGTDNTTGLCNGLPLINPRRVILVDGTASNEFITPSSSKPKKNKQVYRLLETLVAVIPKWDKLTTFVFPYVDVEENATSTERAYALAEALRKSKSLETLLVHGGTSFPDYLRQMRDAPALKSLHITFEMSLRLLILRDTWLDAFRAEVDGDAKLKAIVTYDLPGMNDNQEPATDQDIMRSLHAMLTGRNPLDLPPMPA